MKQIEPLCGDWLFHEGEIPVEAPVQKSPVYMEAKTERRRCGPAAFAYPDAEDFYAAPGLISHTAFTRVTLPHDYVIAQTPRQENNPALGFFRYENAWYRRHFTLPASDAGRRICLFFEGVAIHCEVYVNGCFMLTNRCAYTSFEVDISDVARYGGDNVVAVHIDVSEHEGWWYEGAGIVRPVWLERSERVSVDRDGVFVHPEAGADGAWALPVDVTLRNDGYEDETAQVVCVARDPQGGEAARMGGALSVGAGERQTLQLRGAVEAPQLWDVDAPNLYTMETEVSVRGEVVERHRCRFGFRTIRFDAEKGFFLNGRRVQIQGVCCHQDNGLTGRAMPRRVQRYRLELMREMGANAYRCAHYPHAAATMDALDELGFLVMDETRWFESTPEGLAQLEMLVRRDRNRPGVILWSVGNEEPLHAQDAGLRIARRMRQAVDRLDGTRPVTTAVDRSPASAPVWDAVDVLGVNYNLDQVDALHARRPEQPMLLSECAATGTTRGWYRADCPQRGYINAFDRDTNRTFLAREKTWQFILARPWLAGGFQWAGIEHRGEAVWPRLCSQAGAVDLYLQRKDAFYQNQSHWLRTPVIHLAPHWNWPGMEGRMIRVVAYTNCPRAVLLLDGRLLGECDVAPGAHAEWQVPYAPGRLCAQGLRDGETVCEDAQETTGPAVALRLTLESGGVRADGEDVAILTCDCVDAQGRHVPDAAPLVRFCCDGRGTILGTGSDVADHVPPQCPDRRMRAGRIAVQVRAGTEPGEMLVTAEADGLRPAVLGVMLEKGENG